MDLTSPLRGSTFSFWPVVFPRLAHRGLNDRAATRLKAARASSYNAHAPTSLPRGEGGGELKFTFFGDEAGCVGTVRWIATRASSIVNGKAADLQNRSALPPGGQGFPRGRRKAAGASQKAKGKRPLTPTTHRR